MLIDVVEVRPLDDWKLFLRFEDGVEGVVDVSKRVSFEGVFAPLQDRREFARVTVNREIGTVVWPCGADLDPDVLYSIVSGQPLPAFDDEPAAHDAS